jgi:hypothetical protein
VELLQIKRRPPGISEETLKGEREKGGGYMSRGTLRIDLVKKIEDCQWNERSEVLVNSPELYTEGSGVFEALCNNWLSMLVECKEERGHGLQFSRFKREGKDVSVMGHHLGHCFI